jgi:thiol:disulfide interchange protein DsbC
MKFASIVAAALLLMQPAWSAGDVPEDFETRLNAFFGPSYPISSIAESGMPGVYEVDAGGQIMYVSLHNDLILIGQMYDSINRVSLGEKKREEAMQVKVEKAIPAIPLEEMVIFKGAESKRHITVFTDVECGYCRKLHNEVPLLNQAGIDVRYVWFPQLRDTSRPKAISVACSDDPAKAMTKAKSGKDIPEATCKNAVDEHLAIGRKIGVQGTPFIVLDDMSVIGGYVAATKLIERMGLN